MKTFRYLFRIFVIFGLSYLTGCTCNEDVPNIFNFNLVFLDANTGYNLLTDETFDSFTIFNSQTQTQPFFSNYDDRINVQFTNESVTKNYDKEHSLEYYLTFKNKQDTLLLEFQINKINNCGLLQYEFVNFYINGNLMNDGESMNIEILR